MINASPSPTPPRHGGFTYPPLPPLPFFGSIDSTFYRVREERERSGGARWGATWRYTPWLRSRHTTPPRTVGSSSTARSAVLSLLDYVGPSGSLFFFGRDLLMFVLPWFVGLYDAWFDLFFAKEPPFDLGFLDPIKEWPFRA